MKSEEFASAIETIIKYNANEKEIDFISGANDGRNDIYIL